MTIQQTPPSGSGKRHRLAVLSDIHGNTWALQAVLADVERHHLLCFLDLQVHSTLDI